jgi:hypothetical protein
MAYRPVAKLWLCKQQGLLGNARYLSESNNRTTVMQPVSRQRIGKYAFPTIQWLLETVFSVEFATGLNDEDAGPAEYYRANKL